MSVDKLGSASGILAALRAEISQRTEKTGKKSSRQSDTPELPPSVPGDVKVLRQQLADIVKPISLSDPEAIRAVRPQLVRAILLWEFGATLREHPDWQPMLESITQTLENHPAHEAQFLKLVSELKR